MCCIVQRDLDKHLSEISGSEAQDASRDEIRYQAKRLDAAFAESDQQAFKAVVESVARELKFWAEVL